MDQDSPDTEDRPLSPLATRLVIMGVGAALIVGAIVWSVSGTDDSDQVDDAGTAPSATSPEPTGSDSDDVLSWLPHTIEDLGAAGDVALAYAEQAVTIDYTIDTDGTAQQSALAALSTADHAQVLEAASGAAAARRELAEAGTSTSGSATIDRVERWTSSTVTVVVDVQTVTTDDEGTDTDTTQMVLTLSGPAPEWQVAAVGDSTVGQDGDMGATTDDED